MISESEFTDIIRSRCFYCDSLPANKSVAQSGMILLYSGVDRLDNKGGYTLENCVPCCKTCNFMKRTLSLVDFIAQCREIVKTFDKSGDV